MVLFIAIRKREDGELKPGTQQPMKSQFAYVAAAESNVAAITGRRERMGRLKRTRGDR